MSAISAREYLASLGGTKPERRTHRLDPLRDDLVALYEAGFSAREIYAWVLEHRPVFAANVRATSCAKYDIDTLGAYLRRAQAGLLGRKPGRPRKPLTTPAPAVQRRQVQAANAAATPAGRPAAGAEAGVPADNASRLREQLARRREEQASSGLKFGDDPKSDPRIQPLLKDIVNRDPFAKP